MDCSVNTATILTLIYRFLDRRKIKCNKPKQRNADKSLARPGRKQAKRQKILMFIYPIYNHNWRNFITIYIYNKTSIKRNILTIKQNAWGSRSGQGLISTPIQNNNFACCFVWVWNLVAHIEGGTQAEGVGEQGAEENIWS